MIPSTITMNRRQRPTHTRNRSQTPQHPSISRDSSPEPEVSTQVGSRPDFSFRKQGRDIRPLPKRATQGSISPKPLPNSGTHTLTFRSISASRRYRESSVYDSDGSLAETETEDDGVVADVSDIDDALSFRYHEPSSPSPEEGDQVESLCVSRSSSPPKSASREHFGRNVPRRVEIRHREKKRLRTLESDGSGDEDAQFEAELGPDRSKILELSSTGSEKERLDRTSPTPYLAVPRSRKLFCSPSLIDKTKKITLSSLAHFPSDVSMISDYEGEDQKSSQSESCPESPTPRTLRVPPQSLYPAIPEQVQVWRLEGSTGNIRVPRFHPGVDYNSTPVFAHSISPTNVHLLYEPDASYRPLPSLADEISRDTRARRARRSRQILRRANNKASLWTKLSAAETHETYMAVHFAKVTENARNRARPGEYAENLPGQSTSTKLRKGKSATKKSHSSGGKGQRSKTRRRAKYRKHIEERPNTSKKQVFEVTCIGQINCQIIIESIIMKRLRRNIMAFANYQYRMSPESHKPFIYQPIPPWWGLNVNPDGRAVEEVNTVEGILSPTLQIGEEDEDEEDAEVYNDDDDEMEPFSPELEQEVDEDVLLPSPQLDGDVNDEASDAFFSRPSNHEAYDPSIRPSPLAGHKRRLSTREDIERAEERERTMRRNQLRREEEVREYEAAVAAAERENERRLREEAVVGRLLFQGDAQAHSAPTWDITATTSSQDNQSMASLSLSPATSTSAISDLDEDDEEEIRTELRQPEESDDDDDDDEAESEISGPPHYSDIEPPMPISLPVLESRVVRRRIVSPNLPTYQYPVPGRGAAYSSERTPSPPPPFNAMTDCQTIIPPVFFIEDDDAEEAVLSRLLPSGRVRSPSPEPASISTQQQNIIGAFPLDTIQEVERPTIFNAARIQREQSDIARRQAERAGRAQQAQISGFNDNFISRTSFDAALDMEEGEDFDDDEDVARALGAVDAFDNEDDDEENGVDESAESTLASLTRWVGRLWRA